MHRRTWILALSLLAVAALLGACAPGETPTPEIIEKTVEVKVEVMITPTPIPGGGVPFEDLWAASAHADGSAEAFNHWNEDDPPVIPTFCAKCHSTFGYLDFLGVDGSEPGVVDKDAEVGSVITCIACHNEATVAMDSVVMPSGVEITGLGDEARCMQCHQGRHSTVSVNAALEEAGVEEDTVSEELGFLNIHYFAAAATKYGTVAKGGYEYEGKSYDAFFAHVEGYETCIDCHDPHTLEVKVDECSACHSGVASVEDLRNVRMQGSLVDYDGDGDLSEGIASEIAGLQELLYQAIQAYAAEVAGTPVVYESHAYPYFFIDGDADGQVDEGEAIYPNKYNAWTPRLLKAAYNYQVSQKDPGGYAHGGKYLIQLLYDSIEDLNAALSTPVDISRANRIDDGHFAGSEEAFRHFDEDGAVRASCSKCHSAEGLPLFLREGVTITQPVANGFQCSTCHSDLTTFARYEVTEVTFPSGATLTLEDIGGEDPTMLLCMQCHQGRSSTVSVNGAIAGLPADTVDESLRFINIHYFAAGATLFGTQVQGAYEYAGKSYVGRNAHVASYDQCTECHSTHGLDVKVAECGACHQGVESEEDLHAIRAPGDAVDYDGDGDASEGIAGEIETMREALYAAIQAYAAETIGTPIVYAPYAYPYFFTDTDGDGKPGPGEAIYPNRYASWTPRLLRTAYNYQYASKDPGAFAHNGKYILQVLYDALVDLGADVSGMTRP